MVYTHHDILYIRFENDMENSPRDLTVVVERERDGSNFYNVCNMTFL